jgi:succinate dehydrogenase / fumarate reductase cytochrome b subunit
MAAITRFLQSTILSKIVMAVTGVILVLFLLGHMAGNLQMYSGPEKMNTYAHFLQGLGGMLWFIRAFLALCALLHIITSVRLKLLNLEARPVQYVMKKWVKASINSRTMLWTGSLIGLFLAYHLLHFTFRTTNPGVYMLDATGKPDAWLMVYLSYKNPLISITYVAAMVLLWSHLSHAITSMLQTLGVNHERYNCAINGLGPVLATIIVAGFLSVPVGVLTGLIVPPAGVM